MKLKDASRRFNRDSIYDGYSGAFLYLGHTSAHDDHTSSGATARRRTLRTVPGTSAPSRRVVKIYDDYWLVGNSNDDSFNGQVIRKSYGLKKATGLMARLTPAEACAGAAGTNFHSQIEYYRDLADSLTEAELDTMFNIFCPFSEPLVKGTFLRQGSQLYRIRNMYDTVDEYLVCETDQFDTNALQSAHFTANGAVNLVTDARPTVNVTTNVIQFDTMKFYRFRDKAESDLQAGDRVVFHAASALATKPGARFTMLGQEWQVISVQAELDALALHVRLA